MNAPQEPYPHGAPRPKPNADAYRKAFAAAGIGGLALLVLIFTMSWLPGSTGYAIGRLLVPMAITALFVGYAAKASPKRWRWWQYYLTVIPSVLLLLIVMLRSAG